jgi:hypothetical protein
VIEKALSLKEAADALGVSYSFLYPRRRDLGFFKIGGVWRVWPDELKKRAAGYNADRPARTDDEEHRLCPSESATASTISTCDRQVEKEYAALVGLPTGRKQRSITTE